MTMTALHPARAHAGAWEDLPPLATCSYARYRRDMGTAVRITRMALRGVALPDPRYTDRDHWPVIRSLIPAKAIFHKGLPPAEFTALYRNDLALLGVRLICREISEVTLDPAPAPQRLVLLCYEDVLGDPLTVTPGAANVCHRRAFADWWAHRTGLDVPELG